MTKKRVSKNLRKLSKKSRKVRGMKIKRNKTIRKKNIKGGAYGGGYKKAKGTNEKGTYENPFSEYEWKHLPQNQKKPNMYFYLPRPGQTAVKTKYLGESEGVSPVLLLNNRFVNKPNQKPSTGRTSGVPMGPFQLTRDNEDFSKRMLNMKQISERGNRPSSNRPSSKINYSKLRKFFGSNGGRSRSRSPPGGRSPARSQSPSRGRSRSPARSQNQRR